MPELPDAAAFELPPDWVCEVLSPSTHGIDRVAKRSIYAREKVAWLWLVDPVERTLEVFRLENGHWVVSGNFTGDDAVRAEPFDAIDLVLGALWER
jgi:Uma2 family endonuclease